MAFAYVINNQVLDVQENLPQNWRNISNFFALESKLDILKDLGWYPVEIVIPNYNTATQKLDNWYYVFDGSKVKKIAEVIDIPQPTPQQIEQANRDRINTRWQEIRYQRTELMKSFEWRYTRYMRQTRLGISPTDDIVKLDSYMQALADITQQSDPDNIVWPTFVET